MTVWNKNKNNIQGTLFAILNNFLKINTIYNKKKAMTTSEYEDKGRKKLVEDFKNSKCEMIYEFTQ